jgi:hypothetical protein
MFDHYLADRHLVYVLCGLAALIAVIAYAWDRWRHVWERRFMPPVTRHERVFRNSPHLSEEASAGPDHPA